VFLTGDTYIISFFTWIVETIHSVGWCNVICIRKTLILGIPCYYIVYDQCQIENILGFFFYFYYYYFKTLYVSYVNAYKSRGFNGVGTLHINCTKWNKNLYMHPSRHLYRTSIYVGIMNLLWRHYTTCWQST